jgi:hypothetical protein
MLTDNALRGTLFQNMLIPKFLIPHQLLIIQKEKYKYKELLSDLSTLKILHFLYIKNFIYLYYLVICMMFTAICNAI